ncbi:MAG: translation elongation factor 4 [Caldiserica bacterium]|jgi:GTP-binding protein LepA|nr:translation elongation factor 4 [Caldisericota bacterium]MDH7561907.1 translation elongation factor 4 [Caldisericota bacterium]
MQEKIRNFCIIAHIDHGKSTLADRLLEATGVKLRVQMEQVLDQMDLEREKGITIKAHPVRLEYRAKDGSEYILNLIDTPGHVDFTYEVSRALAACEGALLVVDGTQGVEAQTLANAYLAMDLNLDLVPVINKIDLPNSDPEKAKKEIEEAVLLDASDAILVSAKEGWGTEEVLEAIVKRIRPPRGNPDGPLRALIFDSHYDPYKGVISYIRVVDGKVKVGDRIKMMGTDQTFEVMEVGYFKLGMVPKGELQAGEVGYLAANIKSLSETKVGDTITSAENPASSPLPGFRHLKPMVFCGLYPTRNEDFPALREALQKLSLNDASIVYEPESSPALGFGFRCGFLGLLHMEIVQERLEREYEQELVATAPSVVYRVFLRDGTVFEIDNPAKFPSPETLDHIEEPFVKAIIMVPQEFVGPMMDLAQGKRGIFKNMEYIEGGRVILTYEIPLAEILLDFYDQLKSRSRGYASFDYEFLEYRKTDLVKLDILVNGKQVDALCYILPQEKAYEHARKIVSRLRKTIPRQLFEVVIQGAIGSRIIARETIKPLRKNVLAKCYGGDVTRKMKLLEKQKEGKKRLKKVGNVDIPQEAFFSMLKIDSEE